jgi:hypothetical protein
MPSAWNMFVKKIYEEGKAKDPKYEFKQALVDASKRKSEMGSNSMKKGKTVKKSRGKARKRGKKTRRNYRR